MGLENPNPKHVSECGRASPKSPYGEEDRVYMEHENQLTIILGPNKCVIYIYVCIYVECGTCSLSQGGTSTKVQWHLRVTADTGTQEEYLSLYPV